MNQPEPQQIDEWGGQLDAANEEPDQPVMEGIEDLVEGDEGENEMEEDDEDDDYGDDDEEEEEEEEEEVEEEEEDSEDDIRRAEEEENVVYADIYLPD